TWSSTPSASAHFCAPTTRAEDATSCDGRHCSANFPNTTYVPCGRSAGIGTPRPPTFAAGSNPVPRTTTVSPNVTGASPTGVTPSAANTSTAGSNTGETSAGTTVSVAASVVASGSVPLRNTARTWVP